MGHYGTTVPLGTQITDPRGANMGRYFEVSSGIAQKSVVVILPSRPPCVYLECENDNVEVDVS